MIYGVYVVISNTTKWDACISWWIWLSISKFLLCEEIRSWELLFQIQERLIYLLKYPYGNSTFKIQQGDIKEDTSRNTFLQNHFKAQGRTSTLEAERFIMVPGVERERKSIWHSSHLRPKAIELLRKLAAKLCVDCRPTCRWLWKRPICLRSIWYNMTTQEKHSMTVSTIKVAKRLREERELKKRTQKREIEGC